jgi:type IV pilus assembly protein PilP
MMGSLHETKHTLAFAVVVLLGACAGSEQGEIRDWMKAQRAATPTSIKAVAPPLAFIPAPYLQSASSDPFDDLKLKAALARARAASGASALQPDLARKREALEAFPIDNIKMTGFLLKQGKPTGLLSASGALFNVNVGSYIGQDYGKVIAINEQEIGLKELVQDGAGVWSERTVKLPLILVGKESKK